MKIRYGRPLMIDIHSCRCLPTTTGPQFSSPPRIVHSRCHCSFICQFQLHIVGMVAGAVRKPKSDIVLSIYTMIRRYWPLRHRADSSAGLGRFPIHIITPSLPTFYFELDSGNDHQDDRPHLFRHSRIQLIINTNIIGNMQPYPAG